MSFVGGAKGPRAVESRPRDETADARLAQLDEETKKIVDGSESPCDVAWLSLGIKNDATLDAGGWITSPHQPGLARASVGFFGAGQRLVPIPC